MHSIGKVRKPLVYLLRVVYIPQVMDISNKQLLYKIVCARDKRYDGRFYCGVHTTGIYCRPICPARPKIENITFYRSSAEAEKEGFRACLRCRPDLAPNSVQWNGTAAIVGRALSMISRGDVDENSLEQFANKLGVSDRHLRRLFEEHLGASPIEIASSKRLHLAKQLLVQSNMPVTDIAFASGYQSIRRFNEAFKKNFQSAPSVFRKSRSDILDGRSNFITIEIPIIAPFDWNHIYEFLKNHRADGVESFADGHYQRNFLIENKVGYLDISFDVAKECLLAKISVSNPTQLRCIIEKVRDLFDTRLNPHAHHDQFKTKNPIASLYIKELGIRVPGAWEPFETAISIILGQLVSLDQARFKIKKLIEVLGTKISHPELDTCSHLFPSAKVLAEANYKSIGVTKVREHALRELSRLVWEKKIDLSRSADIEKTKAQLLGIKGIGPWTVEMIAMRCLGDTNAFPRTDLIVKRALEHHKNIKGDWSPWNAYVTLMLWKKYALTLSKKSKPSIILKR